MTPRTFEVVVYGATGFTGKLVCEHLAAQTRDAGRDLRWAIAGRSRRKLQAVAEELGLSSSVGVLTADADDLDALKTMCEQTEAVISTVGPFSLYGTPLVRACVETKTDYCDSTGETTWILKMIRRFHDAAAADGVRIVPSCGYDSIPSDLGTQALLAAVKQELPDVEPGPVQHLIGPTRGGVSGGTLATMVHIIGQEERSVLRDVYGNAYCLAPDEKKRTKVPSHGDQMAPKWFAPAKLWTAPFVMANGNERYVRRSAALLGYGPKFQYAEAMAVGSLLKAIAVAVGMGTFALLLALPPVRWLLVRFVLPSAGTGPTRRQREKGFGTSYMHTQAGGQDFLATVKIAGGDVGYKSTGMMLAETGILLAKTRGSAGPGSGGVLTAASCPGLGEDLAKALAEHAQITFEVQKPKRLSSAIRPAL